MIPLLTSPPELPVPSGRLRWSRGATATVWSQQAMEVWDTLQATGRFELESDEFVPEGFEDAYGWMRRRLHVRYGWRLQGSWPVWGWTRITRRNLLPDCDGDVGQVLMRLEVPRELVVSSHFGGWHSVLNNGPLYPPDLPEDDEAFEAWHAAEWELVHELGGRFGEPVSQWPTEAREYAENSWEAIFAEAAWDRHHSMQCVMPFLEASWLTRAVRIDALSSRQTERK